MTERRFPESLIPPGINDERSRAILGAFETMASEFDFARLLMRQSREMPAEVLPLAIAERSLEEFLDPDGSPEPAVRKLIDLAFVLHQTKGTDAGVLAALAAFGLDAEILQWFDRTPAGPHDTHTITVDASQDIFGDGDLWAGRVFRQVWRVVDAMKRWSQETGLQMAATARAPAYAAVFPMTRINVVALPFVFDPPVASGHLRAGVSPLTRLSIIARAA